MRVRHRPQNIILLVLDSLRHDCVGFYGEPRFHQHHHVQPFPHTPTLDRLAEQGTHFRNAFSVSPDSAPSYVSLLTGVLPSLHGVETALPSMMASDLPTLSSMLSAHGYHTVHAVDFDTLFSSTGLHRGAQSLIHHDDARLLDQLSSRRQPFFLFMQVGELHPPFLKQQLQETGQDPYAPLRSRLGLPTRSSGWRTAQALSLDRSWPAPRGVARWVLEDFFALKTAVQLEGDAFRTFFPLYQEGINHFDQSRLTRLLAGLEALELLDDTLLVITSDKGMGRADDNHFEAGLDLSDGCLHVPLMVVYPGVVLERQVVDAPVSLLDLAPTLLELAGVEAPEGLFRGQSLVGTLLRQEELPSDRAVYSEHWRALPRERGRAPRRVLVGRSVRTEKYKLILQGPDLVGDASILNLIDPSLSMARFVGAINQRYMGLAHVQPLESWLRGRQQTAEEERPDILTDALSLARSTLGRERYRVLQLKRLRSYLAERIQQHHRDNVLNIEGVVQDLYEAWSLRFIPDSLLHRLTLMVRHHCTSLEDVVRIFEQVEPFQPRYRFYDVEMDPFELEELFSGGLSIAQERDALAIEIILMETYLEGRGLEQLRHAPPATETPEPPSQTSHITVG